MTIRKKITKAPAVRVETRKLSTHDTCGCSMNPCHTIKGILILLLLLINTLLIVFVLIRQDRIEADRVGGMENYKMVKEIYKTEMFKQQQAQQIQDALQLYKGGIMPTQEMPVMTTEDDMMLDEMILE